MKVRVLSCIPTQVLNAFRHQRCLHITPEPLPVGVTTCSTPFGIRGVFIGLDFLADFLAVACSTPFGIRGVFIQRGHFPRLYYYECSTPFGIRGVFIIHQP